MPEVERQVELAVPIARVWQYVADMNNWATRIPGYRSHEMHDDRHSTWIVAGDVGILTREVELAVEITGWTEPSEVTFTLEGTEEPVSGNGRFAASPKDGSTDLLFSLSLTAGGPMGPVVNVLMGTQLPRIADEFIAALSEDLLGRETATA